MTKISHERAMTVHDTPPAATRTNPMSNTDIREERGLRRLDEAIRETEKKLRDARTEEDMTRLARATGVYRDGGR